jgi:putative ABC transport system permease protein
VPPRLRFKRSLRPHLRLIALIGMAVPRRLRADWRQEWEAELNSRELLLADWDRLDRRRKLDLLWRSTSAFWDALWMQSYRWEDEMIQDLRFAVRMLLKQPRFALVAVLTLAFGIGANTAIFSVINAVVFQQLPYAKPDRIVAIWDGRGQPSSTQGTTLPKNFQLWREQSSSFSNLALGRDLSYRLEGAEDTTVGLGMEVTPDLFDLLGVAALHGRPLIAGDELSAVRTVVLSHPLWQRNFGGDVNIIGRTVKLNGGAATVVGVMPRQFVFPPKVSLSSGGAAQDCDLWVPMAIDQRRLQTSGKSYLAYGRLKPGVTFNEAQGEMSAFAPGLTEADPALNDQLSIHLALLPELALRAVRPTLSVLLGVVAFILLIACANVANLLLARAAARLREFAIRSALGATRSRVIRQILTECLLLGLLAGLTGLALAFWGLKLLSRIAVIQTPHPVTIDGTVLGFTLVLSLFTSLLFGAGAAWQMTRGAINPLLQEAGRIGAGGVRLGRVRGALAVSQVALSLVLLLTTGLLVRTLWNLLEVDPGFRAQRVLTMDIRLPGTKYPRARAAAAYTEILERAARLPGVVSTGATGLLPIRSNPYTESFQIKGRPMRSKTDLLPAEYRLVTPGYFSVMQIPLLEGRYLSDSDTETSQGVVVISERLAQLYFPQESPIGHSLAFGDSPGEPGQEIVGVVRDIRNWGLAAAPTPEVYVTYRQNPKQMMTLAVRSEGDPMQLASLLRSELRAFDQELVPERVETMEEILTQSLSQRRVNLVLIGTLASLAVGLAAFGLYSLIAYTVALSTHEIGIRLALGAQRRDILSLVLRKGFVLTAVGLALGLGGAMASTRALRSLLFGISPTDPVTFAAITLLLGTVSILACYLPARRAARLDAMVALRRE